MLSFFQNLLDCSTLHGQLIQALMQVIIWYQIFNCIKNYIRFNFNKSKWYLNAIKKDDGEEEFLMLLIAIPQHTTSAICIWLAMYYNSLQLFTMGSLGEFSFEFIELYNILLSKFFYKNCPFKNDIIISMIAHHLPGIITIIPINLYFGLNAYVQRIAFSLLFIAPLLALFFVLYKTRDVYDLQQRGQFILYSFIVIILLIYCRFYWTLNIMIEFMLNEFVMLSMLNKIMFIFYGLLINLFNLLFTIILCKRLYGFLYGNKYVLDNNNIIKCFLEYLNNNNNKLGLNDNEDNIPKFKRCQSTPMSFVVKQNKNKHI